MCSAQPRSGSQRVGLARPVWVNLEELFTSEAPPLVEQLDDHLRLDGEVPGKLHEWQRSARGEWLGVVSYDLHTAAGETVSFYKQLLPQDAIRPRSYGA